MMRQITRLTHFGRLTGKIAAGEYFAQWQIE